MVGFADFGPGVFFSNAYVCALLVKDGKTAYAVAETDIIKVCKCVLIFAVGCSHANIADDVLLVHMPSSTNN